MFCFKLPKLPLSLSLTVSPCPRVSSAFSGLYYGCSAHVEFNSGQELCCLWHCLKIVLICLNTVSVQLKANRDLQAKITFKGLWKMPATLSFFPSQYLFPTLGERFSSSRRRRPGRAFPSSCQKQSDCWFLQHFPLASRRVQVVRSVGRVSSVVGSETFREPHQVSGCDSYLIQ